MIRLIVVDDNTSDIDLLSIAVETWHPEVVVLPCPPAADPVRFISEQARPEDIILIDLNMPAIDGFTVLERLRSVRPDLHRIAILSGSPNPADRARALALGAAEMLRKPDRFAQWPAMLTSILALAEPRP